MEISVSLPLILAGAAVALIATIEFVYLVRRFSRKKPAKAETPIRERQVVLRPPVVVPSLPPPTSPQPESADAVRLVILFTDMVKKMNAAKSAADVPGVLTRTLADMIGTPSVAYFEYKPDEEVLRLTDGRGLPPGLIGTLTFPVGHGKVGYAAQKGMVMEDRDFEWEGPDEKTRIASVPSDGEPTYFCLPMIYQKQLFGVVTVAEPTYKTPHLKKLLAALADLTAIALNNARLVGGYKQSADTDGLTGLFSRGYLAWRLAEEVVRCQKSRDPLSILMMDVDNFKHYNDTNGHPAGDEVLRRVAEALRRNFRKTDIVARYGGEEFSVVMSGLKKDQAFALAERLRAYIEAQDFPHGAKQPLGRVTISAGVATFPQDAATGEELIKAADTALYEAKHAGRNRVVQHLTADLFAEGDFLEPAAGPSGRTAVLEEFLAGAGEGGGNSAAADRTRSTPAAQPDAGDPAGPKPAPASPSYWVP